MYCKYIKSIEINCGLHAYVCSYLRHIIVSAYKPGTCIALLISINLCMEIRINYLGRILTNQIKVIHQSDPRIFYCLSISPIRLHLLIMTNNMQGNIHKLTYIIQQKSDQSDQSNLPIRSRDILLYEYLTNQITGLLIETLSN